jgi:hypothetical protein
VPELASHVNDASPFVEQQREAVLQIGRTRMREAGCLRRTMESATTPGLVCSLRPRQAVFVWKDEPAIVRTSRGHVPRRGDDRQVREPAADKKRVFRAPTSWSTRGWSATGAAGLARLSS